MFTNGMVAGAKVVGRPGIRTTTGRETANGAAGAALRERMVTNGMVAGAWFVAKTENADTTGKTVSVVVVVR